MKDVKTTPSASARKSTTTAPGHAGIGPLFDKDNLKWMLIGIAVLIIGFILMAGGRSNDPNVFNPNQVYGTVRITIAPIIILAGLVIEIVAIFRHSKKS